MHEDGICLYKHLTHKNAEQMSQLVAQQQLAQLYSCCLAATSLPRPVLHHCAATRLPFSFLNHCQQPRLPGARL
jgi:hypothetical protein